jgi:outer membrane protein insertion porin family
MRHQLLFATATIAIASPIHAANGQEAILEPSLDLAPEVKDAKPVPKTLPTNKQQAPKIKTPVKVAPPSEQAVKIDTIVIQSSQGILTPQLEAKVRAAMKVKAGQQVTRTQLQQDFAAIRSTGEFSAVDMVPENTPRGVRLIVTVTPIAQAAAVLRRVNIKTLPANATTVVTPADIDQIFGKLYGQRPTQATLRSALESLQALYKQRGYVLAQIVDVAEIGSDGVLNAIVAEGVIEKVEMRFLAKDGSLLDENKQPIRGNTREYIVTREAEHKAGSVLNRDMLQKDVRRIVRLGLFDDVRVSLAPGSDPAKVVLQFNVLERAVNNLLLGGGLNSTGGLFASGSYRQNNLGGNNQNLGGEIQYGRDLLFNLNYSDPWIGTDPNRLSYTINAFNQRSLSLIYGGGTTPVFLPNSTEVPRILRQGGGVTFSRPLNGNPYIDSEWRASLGVQYQKITVQNDGGATAPLDNGGRNLSASGTGADDLLMAQLGLSQDTRDNFSDPSSGSLFRVGLDRSIPIGQANISMTRVRGSFTQYVPVSLINLSPGNQSLSLNIQGGTVWGDLPPYEAFSIGGVNSVRGYEEGDVGSGRSYVQARAEYKFPVWNVIGAALFADYGSDLGSGDSVPTNPAGLRGKPGNGFGYGAGLRIQSPIGPLKLDYGQNSLGQSRIQFGIGDLF